MKKTLRSPWAVLLLAFYLSLNWGGLVYHHHPGAIQSTGCQIASPLHASSDCPLCQFGAQNIAVVPEIQNSLPFFGLCINQVYPLTPLAFAAEKEPFSARAPPLS